MVKVTDSDVTKWQWFSLWSPMVTTGLVLGGIPSIVEECRCLSTDDVKGLITGSDGMAKGYALVRCPGATDFLFLRLCRLHLLAS